MLAGQGGPWGRTPTEAPGSPWELVLAGRGFAARRAQERQGLGRPGAQGSLKAGPCLQGCTKLQRGCSKPWAWHAVLQEHQQLALRKLQILEVLLTLLNSPKTCWGGLGTRAQRSLLGVLVQMGIMGAFSCFTHWVDVHFGRCPGLLLVLCIPISPGVCCAKTKLFKNNKSLNKPMPCFSIVIATQRESNNAGSWWLLEKVHISRWLLTEVH